MSLLFCVDDDETICEMIGTMLRGAGHSVTCFHNGAEAVQAIAAEEPDLVVLDIDMPGLNGIEVCAQLKANPFTARIPVLMLTARGDVEQKVEGFEAGADDYLTKPFHPVELQARVAALLRLVKRESDRNPTSGLPGGRAIREEIERRVAQSKLSGEHFAICYIDLDHFKAFADTFGFGVADEVIARTAAALCDAVKLASRETDAPLEVSAAQEKSSAPMTNAHFVGHIGGDDFLVLTNPEAAELIARECSRRFARVVAEVLGEDVAQAGDFRGTNRDGEECTFPLASLTTAVLVVDPGDWVSIGHIGTFAAQVKSRQKTHLS